MFIKRLIATATLLALGSTSYAQADDAAALEMARKAQDPLGNGDGLDLNLGAYGMLEKPADAPQRQVKFGISYYFN